ncbi:hypothetical protein L210DRAFT_3521529 [Boletus edulis BED1]|uniref:Uncharacterized protein n=1 Tax=Boletus edulis BED1 TaxID=1328754 RepID=A0AAD4C6W8_BOLED|nr:hypothetical protein L210DRAFT_3521529 [Boletus edulis BED1]
MQHDLHYKFDALRLWFESTDQLGHYEKGFICSLCRTPELSPIIVNLKSQLVHMSGAAGLFDQLEWEAEEEVGEQDVKEWDVNK